MSYHGWLKFPPDVDAVVCRRLLKYVLSGGGDEIGEVAIVKEIDQAFGGSAGQVGYTDVWCSSRPSFPVRGSSRA